MPLNFEPCCVFAIEVCGLLDCTNCSKTGSNVWHATEFYPMGIQPFVNTLGSGRDINC